jgi:hypothetical protein
MKRAEAESKWGRKNQGYAKGQEVELIGDAGKSMSRKRAVGGVNDVEG